MSDTPLLDALRKVPFFPSPKSIVDLDMVLRAERNGARADVTLELPSPEHPDSDSLIDEIKSRLLALAEIEDVRVRTTWRVRESDFRRPPLPGVKNVIAVASGKGGVGKSTVASNLAAGLARLGARVGMADLDIYGPSGTLTLGATEAPGSAAGTAEGQDRLIPGRNPLGIRVLSMGQLVPPGQPIVWRGPMLHQMVTQFQAADWGELDYLVLDLPPGTGDVQLTVTQNMPLTGVVIVTTPQEISLLDARKGLTMFRDAQIPILGIVENMAWYECGKCSKRHPLFGAGGGEALARDENVPLLGQLPLDPHTMQASDVGSPVVLDGDRPAAAAWRDFVRQTAAGAAARSLNRNPFKVLR